jgi:divalent metal cation (Fe/Co/Zn/Cd) transporter
MFGKKGQGAMGIVILAVSVIIGVYLIAAVYNSVDQTGLPSTVTSAIDNTLDIGTAGLTLLGVGIIVAASMFILSLMGSK